MKNDTKIPDELVIVKQSICKKCNSLVRVMVSHTATAKSLKEFEKEVEKYDLDVEYISLITFRRNPREFCSCK